MHGNHQQAAGGWKDTAKTTLYKEEIMRRIFLIGYMGAGKTTLGNALAKKLDLQFIDLDNYIEGRVHKTISEIFAEKGEEEFRQSRLTSKVR